MTIKEKGSLASEPIPIDIDSTSKREGRLRRAGDWITSLASERGTDAMRLYFFRAET